MIANSVEKLKDLNQIPKNSQVVLCGAGALGKFALNMLRSQRKDVGVRYFIDDNKKGKLEDVAIISRDEYVKDHTGNHLFIITSTYWKSFSENLIKSGLTNLVVFDLLSQKGNFLHTKCKIGSVDLIQYTPNLFLELCAANINNIEPDTISWIDSFKPNAVFYDIGASNGVYAMYANKARNAVSVAIEADAQNFAILQNNCYLNKISPEKFTAINIALGSEPSVLKMHSEEFAAGMHSKTVDSAGRQFNQKNAAFSFNTLVERLDFLIEQYKLSYPDYIKIDVDGAEFDVLAGSEKVLRESKAEILIEIPDTSIERLDAYLGRSGYKRTNSYKIFEIIGSQVEGIRNHLYKKHGA